MVNQSLIGRISNLSLTESAGLQDVAVNALTNVIYATESVDGLIYVISGATNSLSSTIGGHRSARWL